MIDLLLLGATGVVTSAALLAIQGRRPFRSRAYAAVVLLAAGYIVAVAAPPAFAFLMSLPPAVRWAIGLIAALVAVRFSPERRHR
jgi:hypothetical protein